ncbi:MAG: hypothetical protein M3416_12165 [Acidobacteriota bacterium]|nr:hypothetical protein [Acidobacteriota bacterium]
MRILRFRRPARRLIPLALTVLAAATLAANALPTPDPAPAPPPAQAEAEAEVITLTPTGFEPAEIYRPAGRVLLAVDNRSGEEEVVLRLEHEDGERVHEGRASRSANALRKAVNLRPGVYTLAEANHPEWQCRITITH